MSHARELDQFYTSRPTAKTCFSLLGRTKGVLTSEDMFLEPSAGDGAFFELMPPGRRLGVDREPKGYKEIQAMDFLTDFVPDPAVKRWVVVGNPPFGKNSSLAVQFFNKAAEFAEVIAFIVPLTFRKQSLQRRLHPNFELLAERILERDSFVFEGNPYSVPCCFQVWVKTKSVRQHVVLPLEHEDFDFCKPDEADFAIRRVGGLAGKVIRHFRDYSPASHYFIRSNIDLEVLLERFESLKWDDVKWNTAGNPSISKRELVAKYGAALRASPKRKQEALAA